MPLTACKKEYVPSIRGYQDLGGGGGGGCKKYLMILNYFDFQNLRPIKSYALWN